MLYSIYYNMFTYDIQRSGNQYVKTTRYVAKGCYITSAYQVSAGVYKAIRVNVVITTRQFTDGKCQTVIDIEDNDGISYHHVMYPHVYTIKGLGRHDFLV